MTILNLCKDSIAVNFRRQANDMVTLMISGGKYDNMSLCGLYVRDDQWVFKCWGSGNDFFKKIGVDHQYSYGYYRLVIDSEADDI